MPGKIKKPRNERSGVVEAKQIELWELVRRAGQTALTADRRGSDSRAGIGAVRRARRNAAGRVQLDIGFQIGRVGNGSTSAQMRFQSVLVGRRINLAEVVNAGILLRGRTRFDEVRNRDGGQQADDRHNDHDFYQRKARLTGVFGLFHFVIFLFLPRRNVATGWFR